MTPVLGSFYDRRGMHHGGVWWCTTGGREAMAKRKAKARTRMAKKADGPVRVSVSFPQADYAELKEIADNKRVSLAWVVREAVANYLNARTPLFGRRGREGA